MSGRLVGQVYDLALPHNEQAIMLALADHGHDDGSHIHPSVAYLAWKTGYSERQVQSILRRLESKGLIEPVAYATGGRGRATEYQMHIERGTRKPPYAPPKGEVSQRVKFPAQKGEVSSTKGEVFSVKGEAITSPQPKNLREPEENPKRGATSAPTPIEPVPISARSSRKREPKLTAEEQAYYAETVPALAAACRIDIRIDGAWAQCQKQLRALYNAQVRPTAAILQREYDQSGGYWYSRDWRGQKGNPPTPPQVTSTWGAATTYRDKNVSATTAPGGNHRASQYDRNMAILYADSAADDMPPPSVIEGRSRHVHQD